jgi:hypothetical protein
MAAGLNGRLTRLERVLAPAPAHRCRACGLRHVRPLTMDLVRHLIGPVSLLAPALQREVAGNPAPKLCLCDPCCGDPGDRWFTQRSHGLDDEPGVV